MYKKVLFSIVSIILLFHPIVNINASTSAYGVERNSSERKLIVSMVYDDSESMKTFNGGKRDAYSNYSVQSLFSLFDNQDQVFVTYTSAPYASEDYSIKDGGRQEIINKLKLHEGGISSPITAVDTAFEKLQMTTANSEDQYWLVILSDGEFSNLSNQKMEGDYLNQYFQSYSDQKMSNGSNVNILFIGIGDDIVLPKEDVEQRIHVLYAQEENDLFDVVDQCAKIMMGCFETTTIDAVDIVKKNKNTVILTNRIALSKLVISMRGQSLNITKCVDDKDTIYKSDGVDLKYDKGSYLVNHKALNGSISYIETDGVFEQGSYEITFDENVDLDNFEIFVKPAVEVRFILSDSVSAKEIEHYYELKKNDKVRLSYALYEVGTNEKIDPKMIHKDVKESFYYNENKNPSIEQVFEVSGEDSFMVDYQFNDVIHIQQELSLTLYDLKLLNQQDSINRLTLLTQPVTYTYQLFHNDHQLTRSEILPLTIKCNMEDGFLSDYTIEEDGNIQLRISYDNGNALKKFCMGWMIVYRLPVQDYQGEITISSTDMNLNISTPVPLRIHKEKAIATFLFMALPFFCILLFLAYLLKARFPKSLKVTKLKLKKEGDKYLGNYEDWQKEYMVKTRFHKWIYYTSWYSLLPFISNRRYVGGMGFLAKGNIFSEHKKIKVLIRPYEIYRVDTKKLSTQYHVEFNEKIITQGFCETGNYLILNTNDGFLVKHGDDVYLYVLRCWRQN